MLERLSGDVQTKGHANGTNKRLNSVTISVAKPPVFGGSGSESGTSGCKELKTNFLGTFFLKLKT